MNTLNELHELAQSRKRKLGNNTYLVVRDDNGYGIRLHDTEVVIHYKDRIVLDSGGHKTRTTKARMNEYTPFNVIQKQKVWYVERVYKSILHKIPFEDGITLYNNGTIKGQGKDPKETIKLTKRVKQYSKDYAKEFMKGNIPKPSNGDCWSCLFHKDGKPTIAKDHIISHLDDKYYVPSMLYNMFDSGCLSQYTLEVICLAWEGHPVENGIYPNLVQEQIQKAIYKFCARDLGIA
jgi:hypothetical protein|tara:strand:+ start:35 stop:739 length:705 start_codon:yes stop_codon:yes gene_type:complete